MTINRFHPKKKKSDPGKKHFKTPLQTAPCHQRKLENFQMFGENSPQSVRTEVLHTYPFGVGVRGRPLPVGLMVEAASVGMVRGRHSSSWE